MRKIIFIADFFADQIAGGGELNNEVLIDDLKRQDIEIKKIQSHLVTAMFLKNHSKYFYIVSNFVNLSFRCRQILMDFDYIIYEHDHKYLKTRNPAYYKDFKAPSRDITNYSFYREAKIILCQSNFHKSIVQKNLNLDNVISLGGNLWSFDSLNVMRTIASQKKKDCCSVMDSSIPHKNSQDAVKYCCSKELEYELIKDSDYIQFLKKLGSNKKFVFFPKTPETLSRVIVEARMMGMSVVTNNLTGASREPWFNLKGEQLIDFMTNRRKEIVATIRGFYDNVREVTVDKPVITIMSTFHEDNGFLEPFLKDIARQTMFDKCELFFVDAGSTGNEKDIIERYMEKHKNIVYHRLEQKTPITQCMNLMIKMSSGKYLTYGNIDDRRRKDCFETLYSALSEDEEIDLVYGECLQTDMPNETFELNSSDGQITDHSKFKFCKENMIKCLPGPIPLWRKSMHEKSGLFDDEGCNYADDWEMWLRAVNDGSNFKKVNEKIGLYFSGGRSQQDRNILQRKEEAQIFYKYAHIFGNNFQKYKSYFDQYLNAAATS